jgi:bifunctional UDP-N-acetylglucosamine pyrophosphorylase/glucosamine-1-phosphate N-acetyltransferase
VKKKSQQLNIVILAAGLGKRMKSRRAKMLHEILGRPIIWHVLNTAKKLKPKQIVVVIGNQAEEVQKVLAGEKLRFVLQKKQLGTAHAVRQAEKYLRKIEGILLVLNGDLPLITVEVLRSLIETHRKSDSDLSIVTTQTEHPEGYGRIIRGEHNAIQEIVEERDATPDQKSIREINCGIYCAKPRPFLQALKKVRTDNIQKEYYLPDALKIMLAKGDRVSALFNPNAEEVLGVNTRSELSSAARILNRRSIDRWMDSGVTILDPETTYIDFGASIGIDTVIYPNVHIEQGVSIGKTCRIFPGCHIVDSAIGDESEILNHSIITSSRVGKKVRIGPFAHLRPGSVIGDEAKIGNFVEVKKSRVGRGSKASHLSYLGDSEIGSDVNIGAGTITCNYDGKKKYKTILADRVFVGSDTQFIAPVKVGKGAYVGAGSTITENVPADSLAIARARQTTIRGWGRKKKKKKKKKTQ